MKLYPESELKKLTKDQLIERLRTVHWFAQNSFNTNISGDTTDLFYWRDKERKYLGNVFMNIVEGKEVGYKRETGPKELSKEKA